MTGGIGYLQGSSPAAHHDKGDAEGYSSEDEANRPAPLTKSSSIANIRPLYSIYVPHSNRPTSVVPMPSAAPDELLRSASVPANVDATLEEGKLSSSHLCSSKT